MDKRFMVVALIGGMMLFPWSVYAMGKKPAGANVPANTTDANRDPYDSGESALYKSEDEKFPSSSVNPLESPLPGGLHPSNVANEDSAINPNRTTGTRGQ